MKDSLFSPSGEMEVFYGRNLKRDCKSDCKRDKFFSPPRLLGTLRNSVVRVFLSRFSPSLAFHRAGKDVSSPFAVQYWPEGQTLQPPIFSPLPVDRVVAWSGASWVVSDWRQGQTLLLDAELNPTARLDKVYNWGSFLRPDLLLLFSSSSFSSSVSSAVTPKCKIQGEISLWQTEGGRSLSLLARTNFGSLALKNETYRPLFRGASMLSRGEICLFLSEIEADYSSKIICHLLRLQPERSCVFFAQDGSKENTLSLERSCVFLSPELSEENTPLTNQSLSLEPAGSFPLSFSDHSGEIFLQPDESFLTGGNVSLRQLEADGRGEKSSPLACCGGKVIPLGCCNLDTILYLEEKEPGWRGPVLYSCFYGTKE